MDVRLEKIKKLWQTFLREWKVLFGDKYTKNKTTLDYLEPQMKKGVKNHDKKIFCRLFWLIMIDRLVGIDWTKYSVISNMYYVVNQIIQRISFTMFWQHWTASSVPRSFYFVQSANQPIYSWYHWIEWEGQYKGSTDVMLYWHKASHVFYLRPEINIKILTDNLFLIVSTSPTTT